MKTQAHIVLVFAIGSGCLYAADMLALVQSDSATDWVTAAQTKLMATGKFSQIDLIDARSSTPTASTLAKYDDVLAWTNNFPNDSVGLGDALAAFYYNNGAYGKHLTIATYALTNPGGISGGVTVGAYTALADSGTFANPDGTLVSMVASDPIFAGVNLSSLTYYHDSGFANPTLASGAKLLATDGHGVYMIARSSNGVVNVNLYPGLGAGFPGVDNSDSFYSLLANTFSSVSQGPAPLPVCSGTTLTGTGGVAQIQLNWTLASGTDHYNVYRGTASGGPYTPIGSTNSATGTYIDKTVAANTTYYYIMREATAANVETCQSNEAKATDAGDTTPPTTSVTWVSPKPNGSGWNNSNVALSFSASDPGGSGVAGISITLNGAQTSPTTEIPGSTATVSITAEGTTVITYFSTDNAGNQETPGTLTIKLDKTPPTATATANPLPNPTTGWNNTDVTVSFSGTDTLSGISSCTAPITFTSNGKGQVAKGYCTDNAGNVSPMATDTVNIDKWSPAPVISGVPQKCELWPPDNKLVHVATLTVSGADTFVVTGTSNQPPDPGQQDIVISGSGVQPRDIQLRAERSGNGGARIYTITAKASTLAGESTTRQFSCTVPHDRGDDKDDKDSKGGDK